MKNRVWFITGCSSGFGKILCEEILSRGEKLVATARKPESLEYLEPLAKAGQLLIQKLDVCNPDQIREAVNATKKTFGRIDVLINNAGYGYMGALEEVNEREIRKVFDTNVFGLFEVTRAVLPMMREQKSGLIINLSSVAGMVALPGAGVYAATKFAVEGHSEALAGEVGPLGIRVTLIEPGAFKTDFAGRSITIAPEMKEYDEALAGPRNYYKTINGTQPGDPVKAARAMIDLADHPNPPLRLVLGKIAMQRVRAKIDQYEKEMKDWAHVSLNVDFS